MWRWRPERVFGGVKSKGEIISEPEHGMARILLV